MINVPRLWNFWAIVSLYDPGRVTLTISKGPSQTGESLCRSLVIWIFCRTKSPTLKLWELMLRAWYRFIACRCFADWMTAASHNSSNLVKSSTRESFDCYSSKNYWTRKDLCSTLVGNIASEPYTSENGVWPMARFGVVRIAHKADGNSFIHVLA
jgi:hypothetical protein